MTLFDAFMVLVGNCSHMGWDGIKVILPFALVGTVMADLLYGFMKMLCKR